MLKYRNILHPTDFSKNSENAWHLACALARDHGAALTLVHVNLLPTVAYGEFGALPPEAYDQPTLEAELNKIEPTDAKLSVRRFLLAGDPATEIARFAKEQGCDLIVMGTHGRTGLGRLLMGSVAEVVTRKAPCPVLTVKTPFVDNGVEVRHATMGCCAADRPAAAKA